MVGLTRDQKKALAYLEQRTEDLKRTYIDAGILTAETIAYISKHFKKDEAENPRNIIPPSARRLIEHVYDGLMSKGYWDEADKFRFAVQINFTR
ncbi:MAG: hypothetical protein V1802_01585 [Candidatus Aenigmatarchaeota archaeon]